MPLIRDRERVIEVFEEAAERGRVLVDFNSENQSCTEAILSAAREFGESIDEPDLPIIVGITNLYWHRPQATLYSHSRRWETGLRMFLDDLEILCEPDSPWSDLRVMVHLDHIQWDQDRDLLQWDMDQFSSVMYDASTLSFEENIARTARFVQKQGDKIYVEGACDEIKEGEEKGADMQLTTPDQAARYADRTGVDLMVANVGTEHRAAGADRHYERDLARSISERVNTGLCLHGTSSVPAEQLGTLFGDGIRKVNVWTALERDSSPALLLDMLRNAARVAGPDRAKRWAEKGLLGPDADLNSPPSLDHYTTTYRQNIVFEEMKDVVKQYLKLWY